VGAMKTTDSHMHDARPEAPAIVLRDRDAEQPDARKTRLT